MIEQLFGSKTRVKLLHMFFNNPNRSFYVREITRKIGEQINSVRRELSNLLSIGIITSDSSNNRLYYEVNQKYEHYDALKSVFTGAKKVPVAVKKDEAQEQTDRIRQIGSVKLALLTGSFVREPHINVDLFLVGDINRAKLKNLIEELEQEEGRELFYAVMDAEDFMYRKSLKDRFVSDVLDAKKMVVVDELGVTA